MNNLTTKTPFLWRFADEAYVQSKKTYEYDNILELNLSNSSSKIPYITLDNTMHRTLTTTDAKDENSDTDRQF